MSTLIAAYMADVHGTYLTFAITEEYKNGNRRV